MLHKVIPKFKIMFNSISTANFDFFIATIIYSCLFS